MRNTVPQLTRGLSVEGLTVRYGDRDVVRGVSFTAEPGEVFGILGPSGAGKSSVLLGLTGVVPAAGLVSHGDEELSRLPPRKRHFGHVYQEFRLFDWMSVYDNAAYPCRARGWDETRTRGEVESILDRLGMSGRGNDIVHDMSGGERQRVALARAIAFGPRALLLDEPFSHLDPPLREELRRDLLALLAETRMPVVLVTHDHDEASAICDRVGILMNGSLTQVGTPTEVMDRPSSAKVAEFLGYSNELNAELVGNEGGYVVAKAGNEYWRGQGTGVIHTARVRLLCRPRDVEIIVDHRPGNSAKARVFSSHLLGDQVEVVVELDGGALWSLKFPTGDGKPVAGQAVWCHVPEDRVRVFVDDAG